MANDSKKATELAARLGLRGVADIVPAAVLEEKLASKKPLRLYLGIDPTGPDIHIGHAVILRAMRRLQDLGHEIILLIGDFTARIGDPTDKQAARTTMSHQEILDNAKTYQEQASKILRFTGDNPVQLKFNATWLDKLNFADVLELASKFTVQQMLERDMFANRMKEEKPIHLHEFLYPLMQGYDSVALETDIEVGGNDQLFNMMAGRTLLKEIKGKEKVVITFELLEGLDGRKMSKSYHNIIGVSDAPNDMFGKVMAVKDDLLPRYFWLCTDLEQAEIDSIIAGHPRDAKIRLAKEIVTLYHSAAAGAAAEAEFAAVFTDKGKPADMPELRIAVGASLIDAVVSSGAAKTTSDARRKIEQGGVRVNDQKMSDIATAPDWNAGDVLQVGKRQFFHIIVG